MKVKINNINRKETMKVTGYQLREALRHWRSVQDGLAADLKGSLYYFDAKDKVDPLVVAKNYQAAEDAVARLEEAQQKYNLKVDVKISDVSQTLTYAIKALGMAGRYVAVWKAVATDKEGISRWGDRYERVRNKDEVHAKRSITKSEATKMHIAANRHASELRQVIALANATELEIDIPENLVNFGR
jgi:cell fate (sporulation/competence/biofilm development) regulator YlbF (YheA/YmcA/DUF963 family)